jgi:hypothetical protein
MTFRISIVHDLPKSRWGASHMPNKQPIGWKENLKFLRLMWEEGEDTILETAFYEPFEKPKRILE